eukprot:SAG31_NODE_10_length_40133_cov_27.863041_7_plen_83_part_00
MLQGARSNSELFVAETCFDRLVLVPPLLLMIILYSRFMLCLAFLVLDPVLAMLTALRWQQDEKENAQKNRTAVPEDATSKNK